ncbi:MAG TPA: beta-propeller fold lactonase family protein [Urbifossiella sp.]|nr:beta-propeller fold lactonase family protein [Urbifossiella sp.]
MSRLFALVLPVLFAPLAAAPAQQPKDKKLTLQAAAEMKFQVQGHVHEVAVSPDGKLVAVGTEDVFLYDISGADPKKVAFFDSTVGFGITTLTFTPDGKHVVFGGRDWTVRVWGVEGRRETGRVKEHRSDVRSVAVSPDGKLVASGSQDRTAILWDLGEDGSLKEKHVIRADGASGDAIQAVAFVSKGKGLYTVTPQGTFRGYTLAKGEPKLTGGFKPPKGGVGSACIVPNAAGTLFAVADNAAVHLVTPTGTAAGSLAGPAGHKDDVTGVSFSADGKHVATCGRDGTVIVWDVATKAARYTKVRPGTFSDVAFSPYVNAVTGEMTLAACQDDGTVHVVRLAPR